MVAVSLLLNCGARSGLGASDGTRGSTSSTTGTSTGSGGASPDGGPPPSCRLLLDGAPTELLAFPDRHAEAPSMVVLDPGKASTQSPARIALQAFASGGSSALHPDIQIMSASIGAGPWPGGIQVEHPAQLFGVEAHGWAELARAPEPHAQLAIGWFSDPGMVGRTAFRSLATDSWVAGPPVDVYAEGRPALDLVAGAAIGPGGVQPEGYGYAIVWRHVDFESEESLSWPMVAVLDEKGAITLGPHPASAPSKYPGRSPRLSWSGSAYLVATAFDSCGQDDPLCKPNAVTIGRIRPAGPASDSGLDLAGSVATIHPQAIPRRPAIDSYGGRSWVAWTEALTDPENAPRTLRLAQLSPTGEILGAPLVVAEGVQPVGAMSLHASQHGISILLAEDGDPQLPNEAHGRSKIVVWHLDGEGAPLQAPIRIPSPRFDTYGPPSAVAIANPPGLLLTWSAQGFSGHDVVQLARLTCTDAPPCNGAADCGPETFCASECCAGPGLCLPSSKQCDTGCTGVTACDAKTYCNACNAQGAGQSVPTASCYGGSYFAEVGPLGAYDRMRIIKTDYVRELCFHLWLESPQEGGPYSVTMPEQWQLVAARVGELTGDCLGPSPPGAVDAKEAVGSISWPLPSPGIPCQLDVQLGLTFAPEQPWVPQLELFEAIQLPVEGCWP